MGKRKFSSDVSRATKYRRQECWHDCEESSFSCTSEDINSDDFSSENSILFNEEGSDSKGKASSEDEFYCMMHHNGVDITEGLEGDNDVNEEVNDTSN